ncbi:MAG TPA: hypothetical protein VMF88_13965 [Bacteroidota bacterium]|nr:hypothetical protein [Bacteroidota bacterium]
MIHNSAPPRLHVLLFEESTCCSLASTCNPSKGCFEGALASSRKSGAPFRMKETVV